MGFAIEICCMDYGVKSCFRVISKSYYEAFFVSCLKFLFDYKKFLAENQDHVMIVYIFFVYYISKLC